MDPQAEDNTDYCAVCKEDGETTPATLWCSECEAFLCLSCLKLHNKMPLLRHHGVSGQPGKTASVNLEKFKKSKFVCTEHDKKIKVFCKDCEKTLCTVCCCLHHRACKDVVTIQAMLPEVKQELSDRRNGITDDIRNTSKRIIEEKKILDEVFAKPSALKTEIKQVVDNAITLLQQKEKELITKIDVIRNKQAEYLRANIKSEEHTIQVYEQQSQLLQQALTFEDEAQLYEMYLSSQTEDVADSTGDISDITDISFTYSMEKLIEDIEMMDVRTAYDDVIDLSATPVLQEVFEMKIDDDITGSDLRDLVVLSANGITSIVVTDQANKCIKSVYVRNGKNVNCKLNTNGYPWSLTVLNQSKVAVSLPLSKEILIVGVNPELVLLSTITTDKMYYGLAFLDQSTLVAGTTSSPPSVDVLDMTGIALRPFTEICTFKNPYFIRVTKHGKTIVSDWNSVICLKPTGKVVFNYSPPGERALVDSHGITSTARGDILVVDLSSQKVVHLSRSGQFVKDILTSQNGIDDPISLCIDGNKLYVLTRYKGVHVFIFSK